MNLPIPTAAQLSTHLKSLRKTHGLTQVQLGVRIGVKQARIADIERNPGAISVDQLLQLLHALDARLELVPPRAPAAQPPASPADW